MPDALIDSLFNSMYAHIPDPLLKQWNQTHQQPIDTQPQAMAKQSNATQLAREVNLIRSRTRRGTLVASARPCNQLATRSSTQPQVAAASTTYLDCAGHTRTQRPSPAHSPPWRGRTYIGRPDGSLSINPSLAPGLPYLPRGGRIVKIHLRQEQRGPDVMFSTAAESQSQCSACCLPQVHLA